MQYKIKNTIKISIFRNTKIRTYILDAKGLPSLTMQQLLITLQKIFFVLISYMLVQYNAYQHLHPYWLNMNLLKVLNQEKHHPVIKYYYRAFLTFVNII